MREICDFPSRDKMSLQNQDSFKKYKHILHNKRMLKENLIKEY